MCLKTNKIPLTNTLGTNRLCICTSVRILGINITIIIYSVYIRIVYVLGIEYVPTFIFLQLFCRR